MAKIKVLFIPAEDHLPMEVREVENTLEGFVPLINDGYLQVITLYNPRACMWMDEEGKFKGLQLNQRATILTRQHDAGLAHTDFIKGPAFITGVPVRDEDTDAPDLFLALAEAQDARG